MSPVGRGGMGMVWHAHDVLLDRDVAVKELILPYGLDHAGKQVAHRRMLREARSAARLTHPGIVTVHDVVEEDGRPWIVMELVRAWSLEQAVRQSGPLPVIQAAEIGIRVLDALMVAHAAGILHRDIKPGNVLLTQDRVVLTDFGIAAIEGDVTITQTGLLMGSPAYIPPERLSGQPITQAADLWSFGATLYAAVEGRPPYEGPDPVAVLGSVLTQDPIRPQRAGSLMPVIEGLLRKNPAERLTAPQVIEMLEAVLRAHGSPRPRAPETLPSQADPTPAGLLPPLDTPSGPMPSRIVETPSGPVRVPYDPLNSPSGGHAMPYEGMTSPSGSHRTDQLPPLPRAPQPQQRGTYDSPAGSSGGYDSLASSSGGYDSLSSSSGPYDSLSSSSGPYDSLGSSSGPYDSLSSSSGPYNVQAGPRPPFGAPPGPRLGRDLDDLDDPSGPHPQPILPLTTDSRTSSAATPWPLASPDDLREQSRDLSHDISRSRLATLPGGGPRTGKSRRRVEDEDGPWIRDGRPTALTIISSLVAVAVVAGALWIVLTGGSSQTPIPASATVSESATTDDASEPSIIPEGYQEHTGPGFSAAVPVDWKLATSGGVATFSGPKDSGMRILVERAAPQADGGLSELSRLEADGGMESYIQVQLQRVDYRDWQAADWEYTYTTANGVPMHALTRYVSMDTAAFKITIDLPELKWDDQADSRKFFFDTFRQAT
ncbi:serine/threonine-protein kinase [Nonomuraea gerenzanensis]|uniref:non-specific serine/threonine protein kinase n=1 Tax=Nonomuraea gerenzanensis TaxID=93944 RepID=A0A1M4EJI5_9ACTN|nr:serine/threonine-protein kinase [Nonomuraea gerenzanensis]UBU10631.1 protein kinase [Nonomuraea gerenzanensis]SBO99045.1 serine/threonine protein kinase [Nonomuraea gerenzanensis]